MKLRVLEGAGVVGIQEEGMQNSCSLKLCSKTFLVQTSK